MVLIRFSSLVLIKFGAVLQIGVGKSLCSSLGFQRSHSKLFIVSVGKVIESYGSQFYYCMNFKSSRNL